MASSRRLRLDQRRRPVHAFRALCMVPRSRVGRQLCLLIQAVTVGKAERSYQHREKAEKVLPRGFCTRRGSARLRSLKRGCTCSQLWGSRQKLRSGGVPAGSGKGCARPPCTRLRITHLHCRRRCEWTGGWGSPHCWSACRAG